jgi:hypothetical protein
MERAADVATQQPYTGRIEARTESFVSGVSWGAVIAGAIAASALSLVLFFLGSGLGLSAVSPWQGEGASGKTLGIAGVGWVLLTQLAAAIIGGYIAGRLRVKWSGVHTDEVYFRDTAHGFLAWCAGTLIAAFFIGSMASMMASATAKAGATVAAGAATAAATAAAPAVSNAADKAGQGAEGGMMTGMVDKLFRSSQAPAAGADRGAARAETGRILARAATSGEISADDRTYLSQLVAANTGVTPEEAQKRVDAIAAQMKETETQAREAADTARKATRHVALWTFAGLLIGAFCASLAGVWGGRRRDHVYT